MSRSTGLLHSGNIDRQDRQDKQDEKLLQRKLTGSMIGSGSREACSIKSLSTIHYSLSHAPAPHDGADHTSVKHRSDP